MLIYAIFTSAVQAVTPGKISQFSVFALSHARRDAYALKSGCVFSGGWRPA